MTDKNYKYIYKYIKVIWDRHDISNHLKIRWHKQTTCFFNDISFHLMSLPLMYCKDSYRKLFQ